MGIKLSPDITLKAAALPMALSFSLLFLLITMTLLDHSRILTKELNEIKSREQVIRGIDHIEDSILNSGRELNLGSRIHQHEGSYTEATVTNWGAFMLLLAKPENKALRNSRSLFLCREAGNGYGAFTDEEQVFIAGDVTLKGTFYARKQLRKTRIEGISLNPDLSNAIILERKGFDNPNIEFELPEDCKPIRQVPAECSNSFMQPAMRFSSLSDISLSNCTLRGNIVLESGKSIIIDSSCVFEDILIKATKIKVGENVRGNFQCFATELLKIGKGCKLTFPSALFMSKESQGKIIIDEDVSIEGVIGIIEDHVAQTGTIVQHEPTKATGSSIPGYDPVQINYTKKEKVGFRIAEHKAGRENLLILGKSSKVKGQVFWKGAVINHGTLKGSFQIEHSTYQTASQTHVNFLAEGSWLVDEQMQCMIMADRIVDIETKEPTWYRIAKRSG